MSPTMWLSTASTDHSVSSQLANSPTGGTSFLFHPQVSLQVTSWPEIVLCVPFKCSSHTSCMKTVRSSSQSWPAFNKKSFTSNLISSVHVVHETNASLCCFSKLIILLGEKKLRWWLAAPNFAGRQLDRVTAACFLYLHLPAHPPTAPNFCNWPKHQKIQSRCGWYLPHFRNQQCFKQWRM